MCARETEMRLEFDPKLPLLFADPAMQSTYYYRLGPPASLLADPPGNVAPDGQNAYPRHFVDAPASITTQFCARPAGKALLVALEPGDDVVIAHADTLGHNIRAVLVAISLLRENGAVVQIEDFFGATLDTSSELGQALLRMVGDLAAQESRLRSERIRDARMHRLAAGYGVTAHPPLGYRYKPTREMNQRGRPVMLLVPNEREQQWVLRILRWQAEGYSLPEIYRMLRRRRVRYFSLRRLRSHFYGRGRRKTLWWVCGDTVPDGRTIRPST